MRSIVQNVRFKKPTATGVDGNALAKMLEESYLSQKREDKHTQKFSFSPSSIGYGSATCPRYWHIAFDGAFFENDTDALGVANMAYGSQAHDRIQSMFEKSGTLVEQEREIKTQNPPIRGFIDLIVRDEQGEAIGEIKTTRQESFVSRQATMTPMYYHRYQLLLYMWATGIKRGFFLYENKNTQEFLVVPIELDEKNEKILNDTLDWMRLVRKNWEDKSPLPKRPVTRKNAALCKGCPVKKVCWEELPDTENVIPVMEVVK